MYVMSQSAVSRAAGSAQPCTSAQRHGSRKAPVQRLVGAQSHLSSEWHADKAVQDVSRRAVLSAAVSLVSLLSLQQPALADSDLPKSYTDTARKLVRVLQESITKDLSGAEEREIRKAAEPAQDLVRQLMTRWQGQPAVVSDESYRQLTASIQELGAFYKQAGARARMREDVGNSILTKLAAAEDALGPEPEKKSLLPF